MLISPLQEFYEESTINEIIPIFQMRKLRPKVTQGVSGRARVSGSSLALEPVCFITALCRQETSACLILSSEARNTVPGTYNHSQNGVFPFSNCLLGLS